MGFCSYPRSDFGASDAVPSAAYAHIGDPEIRNAVRNGMRRSYQAVNTQTRLERAFIFATPPQQAMAQYRQAQANNDAATMRRIEAVYPDAQAGLFPEPGAVPGAMPTVAADSRDTHAVQSTWDDEAAMSPADRSSFGSGTLTRPDFTDDTLLYRFIGGCRDEYGAVRQTNNPNGSFIGVGPIPITEAEWRARCAIRGDWIGDGSYLAIRFGALPPHIQALIRHTGIVGTIAAQPSIKDGFYLPGGAQQLFLPRWENAAGDRVAVPVFTAAVGSELVELGELETLYPSRWNPHHDA